MTVLTNRKGKVSSYNNQNFDRIFIFCFTLYMIFVFEVYVWRKNAPYFIHSHHKTVEIVAKRLVFKTFWHYILTDI